ncbi:hypothetical protein GP486_007978, partial [Trichoglossum hirsutum]
MVNIIHRNHRADSVYEGTVVKALDCWYSGGRSPTADELMLKKCGHGLNYFDMKPTLSFYTRLAQSSISLGTTGPLASSVRSAS